ncbi:MAG: hypothetical protein ABIT20_15900 [Gemmatimonadaceae bacterium]
MTKTNASQPWLFSTRGSVIVAGLLIGGSLTLKLLTPDVISRELALRLLGVMLGAFVVVYANAVPKMLPPIMRGDAAAEQAMRRFTGWCLTLGGVAYAAAWIIAPLNRANLLAVASLGGAHLIVVARWLYGRSQRRRA